MAGHRLGRVLSDIVADTQVKVRKGLMRFEQESIAKRHTAQMEIWERELRSVNESTYRLLTDKPDVPPEVKAVLDKIVTTSNQTDLFIQLAAIVGLVFGAGSAAAGPTLQWISNTVWEGHPRKPLSPDVAAALVARRKRTFPDMVGQARQNGLNDDRFREMVDADHQALPMGEAMDLWRRDRISQGDFLLNAGHVGIDPDKVAWLTGLRFNVMDPGVATAARVEGHINGDQHAEALAWHGIDPKWADVMYHTAGRPPGVQELLSLANRRLISQETVTQAVLESDIKDKYIPAIWESRVYLPPVRSVVAMMRSGALDPQRGRELLADQGVRPVDIEGYVKEATQGKTAHAKSLAIGAVLTMYQDFEVDRPTAERMLTNLHYDQESILLELAHAEHQREKTIRSAVVSRVRAQYDRRHINRTQASGALDTAGVPTQTREMLLRNWDVEREVDAPQLTVAQITQGFKKGGITAEQMQARFEGLGYNPVDVQVLLHLAGAV